MIQMITILVLSFFLKYLLLICSFGKQSNSLKNHFLLFLSFFTFNSNGSLLHFYECGENEYSLGITSPTVPNKYFSYVA